MRAALTLGETMALLDPLQDGPIDDGSRFRLRIAGAESNFAIALARLGIPVTWVSRVGADAFGKLVVSSVASEGVDVGNVKVDPAAPTGIYFKVREEGRSSVFYYRSGSAASRLGPGDVPEDAWEGVGLVHLTGITMAISPTARDLVVETAVRARKQGAIVIFDPNYRPALWMHPEQAADAYRAVLPSADWYVCGSEEGKLLFGAEDVGDLFHELRQTGVGGAVVRVGERGALLDTGGGPVEIASTSLETVLDEVGAGDGFAAGFAYGLLRELEPRDCVAVGNLVAASALRGTGDWETFPSLEEIGPLIDALEEGTNSIP
jgi:2-dehydro-3-deoxygluconokinase